MISIDQYFGAFIHHHEVTEEIMDNASNLLDHVDKLMAYAIEDMLTIPVNPDTNSQVSGREYGGFRPSDCPIGAKTSAHKTGLAVDIYDPHNTLDEWITDEMLEECGLYREAPSSTPHWTHLSVRRPPSGHRTFQP